MKKSYKYKSLQLSELIQADLSPFQIEWLNRAITELADTDDLDNQLLNLSVVVRRQFEQQIELTEPILKQLKLDLAEFIRIILISRSLERLELNSQTINLQNLNNEEPNSLATNEKNQLIKQYYQLGDESEKCALLKGLILFDNSGAAVQTAVRACRCNSLVEYTAIALNNPYPSVHFAELNFNQLVLKSLFMGLDISQISGLVNRANIKLSNMCFAYAIEQALADRVPHPSIWQVIIFSQLDDENQIHLKHYLTHFYHLDKAHQAKINQQLQRQNTVIELA